MQLPRDAFACRVTHWELVGDVTIVFELDGAAAGQTYAPGAHLELLLEAGPRQYSLCNRPGRCFRLAVQREAHGRGGSIEVFERVQRGEALWVRGPNNVFAASSLMRTEHALLIAGGIGITPILAMAYARFDAGLPFTLHYSGRHARDMAFVSELKAMAALRPDLASIHLYCTRDAGGRRADLAESLGMYDARTEVFLCGSGRLLDAVQDAAFALGWPEEAIHFERFSAELPKPQAGDAEFQVEIASTGQRITVGAEETVADALARSGVVIPISCAAGVCGSCRTRLLSGEADHRDLFYSPEEQAGQTEFTPCCSRAHSPLLVLDL
ncbi:PDR/VanB family oxidoreductase [Lampropedia cohaerens]|uniref:PDR/VanB family oxidoreductase n=1 Tax=Lampropedia cohaerens TaxID=1610491 RepID=UPI0018D26692|nr:PDR/VanB family oxidoreductase [Lampropedia cohaerens]